MLICHKTQPNKQILYIEYMYKQDLAFNHLQGLICHRTKPKTVFFINLAFFMQMNINNLLFIPGDLGSIPGQVIPKTLKMVLDTSLLNTQQYKVCIKGKVE